MRPGRSDRVWRRLAIAAPLSLFAHFLVLMLTRPEYRPVADMAVDMDVLEARPGPPPGAPEPEEPPPEPEPVPKAPPPDDGIAMPKEEAVAAGEEVGADAGAVAEAGADAGAIAAGQPDAGPAGEGGICLHDLFPYAPEDPSWLAWVSMKSFRGTEFESGFARLLSACTLYRDMAGATGLEPGRDVEGFLVTADPFDDPASYRVIATYDSGQSALLDALSASSKGAAGFSLVETTAGYEAAVPGRYRWHLVGSGRVLAVTSEPAGPAAAAPRETDAGTAAPRAPSHPEWPRDVACLGDPAAAKAPRRKAAAPPPFGAIVRGLVGPDAGGHWPVLVIATRDPRALGLSKEKLPAKLLWAYGGVHFSEPMRAEGAVAFDGTPEQVAAIAQEWRGMLSRAGSDPFLALAGLNGVLDKVVLEADGTRIRFSLPLKGRQIQAALIMLEMQAGAVDGQIHRGR